MKKFVLPLLFCAMLLPGLLSDGFAGPRTAQAAAQASQVSQTANADEVIRIGMVSAYPPDHAVVREILQPWFEDLKTRTGGRLLLSLLPGGSIGPEREYFEAVQKGLAGVGHHAVSLNRWQLPAASVMDIPSGLANSYAASLAFWQLFEESPEIQAEFAGIKVLAVHSSAPNQFNMSKGSINMLDDFRDKRLLAPSAEHARILRALNAKPRVMHMSQFQDFLERGLANGCMLPLEALRSVGADAPINNLTLANLYLSAFWLGMNQELYDSLPPDCRAAINETTGKTMVAAIGAALAEANRQNLRLLAASGVAVNKITFAERLRWLDLIIPPTREEWFRLAAQRRLKSPEILHERSVLIFRQAAEKYAHMN